MSGPTSSHMNTFSFIQKAADAMMNGSRTTSRSVALLLEPSATGLSALSASTRSRSASESGRRS